MKKYNLVLPIAGKAQRFIDAGYLMPKPLILAKGKHVIDWSLESIDTSDCNLIFIVRLDHIYNFSIDKILKQKFGDDISIVTVDYVTQGALETCTLAERYIDNELPLYIYTPDVYFLPQFKPDCISSDTDGFLLTFQANSPDHSYADIGAGGNVTRVVEKEVISEHANVGLYYFKTGKMFLQYAWEAISNGLLIKGEYYIAPIYNYMIRDGLKVTACDTEKMHILGTPATFEFFCDRVLPNFGDKPVAVACDHSGYELKEQFVDLLEEYLIPYIDCGTYVNKPCDYYDYVSQSAQLINNNDCDFGVSFCRSGQGVNISANKAGLISALCFDEFTAEMAVRHNCANHFAVPSKYVDKEMMRKMIQIWCTTSFDGGRHFTRLNKVLK
jgi:RpiB/LacA/LacB family sugar-phosphate isomerase